ncbi:hypothetical protein O181_036650 [Austropuccinia psidii MF-1]|uniref:Uncharacterized protein n=1 Tax=Austropuccinia psidii MF-1 TaxID=1389203 RepID=A0A9Q3D6W2_9BASI|nr:hypothetical protein [Austropuccinia psidii MF-1]
MSKFSWMIQRLHLSHSQQKSKVLETRVKLGARCLSTGRDQLWHQRLVYLNNKETKALIPTYLAARKICDECFKGNLTGIPFSHSVWEEDFNDSLEEQPPRRIRLIGPRHLTLITGDISEDNILPYRRSAHQTFETLVTNTYQKVINSKQCKEWEKAITKELESMEKLEVWTIRDKKPEDHPMTCTWGFKIKKEKKTGNRAQRQTLQTRIPPNSRVILPKNILPHWSNQPIMSTHFECCSQ